MDLFDSINTLSLEKYLSVQDLLSLSLVSSNANTMAYAIINQQYIDIESMNMDELQYTPKHILNNLKIEKMVIGYPDCEIDVCVSDTSFEYLRYADTVDVKYLIVSDEGAKDLVHKFKSIDILQIINTPNHITLPVQLCIYEDYHFGKNNGVLAKAKDYVFSNCTCDDDFSFDEFKYANSYKFSDKKFVGLFKFLSENNNYKYTRLRNYAYIHQFTRIV